MKQLFLQLRGGALVHRGRIIDPRGQYVDRAIALSHRFKSLPEQQLVMKAYQLAWLGHQGQIRKQGTPYIEHALATAETIANWGGSAEEAAAALGHDLIEEGRINGRRVTAGLLRGRLGDRVAAIIDGVTELGKSPGTVIKDPSLPNIWLHYLDRGRREPAVFKVKLADRLNNMQTLPYVSPFQQREKADETLHIYCRIADMLGMWPVKRQLEDICFRYLEPEKHRLIYDVRQRTVNASLPEIRMISFRIDSALKRAKIAVKMQMEKRAVYELYKRAKGRELADIAPSDVWRLCIKTISDDPRSCYDVLEVLHKLYPPVQPEYRDYIAAPRPDGQQFLRTVVDGPFCLPVQIRDQAMTRAYELGTVKNDFAWLDALRQALKAEGVGDRDLRRLFRQFT